MSAPLVPSPPPIPGGPAGVLAGVVAAGCVYEIGAQAVNRVLDEDVMPSFTGLMDRVTLRRLAASRPPPWARTGTTMGVGFASFVLGTARRSRRVGSR